MNEEEIRKSNEQYYQRLRDDIVELEERWRHTGTAREATPGMCQQIPVSLYVVEKLLIAWKHYGYEWDRRQGMLEDMKRDSYSVLFMTGVALMGSTVGGIAKTWWVAYLGVIGVVALSYVFVVLIRISVRRTMDKELRDLRKLI